MNALLILGVFVLQVFFIGYCLSRFIGMKLVPEIFILVCD